MRTSALLPTIAAIGITLGLAVPGAAASKTCKDNLTGNVYQCSAVTSDDFEFDMEFEFSGSEAGDLFLNIGETAFGACACKAKKPSPRKPEKIGFDSTRDFHCMMGGADGFIVLGGPEGGGGDLGTSFDVRDASFEGSAKKPEKIQKGQAVDFDGTQLVYECEQLELGGPEMGGGA